MTRTLTINVCRRIMALPLWYHGLRKWLKEQNYIRSHCRKPRIVKLQPQVSRKYIEIAFCIASQPTTNEAWITFFLVQNSLKYVYFIHISWPLKFSTNRHKSHEIACKNCKISSKKCLIWVHKFTYQTCPKNLRWSRMQIK